MQATLDRIDSPEGFILDPSLVLYLPLYRLDGASFMSKDAYGHLCTVTGALWTPQGRSFDGVDDYVNCGVSLPHIADQITIELWAYIDEGEANASLTFKGFDWRIFVITEADDTVTVRFSMADTEAVSTVIDVSGISKRVWHHLTMSFISNGGTCYACVDGVQSSPKTSTALPFRDRSTYKLYIGGNATDYSFGGLIGEARIRNRALNALEIQYNYISTRFRYQ